MDLLRLVEIFLQLHDLSNAKNVASDPVSEFVDFSAALSGF